MPRRAIVICFGRFQPPTTGHESLLQFALKTAHRFRADVRVYPSQSQDAKKNPLPFVEKVRFLKMLFPHIQFNDNPRIRTPFDALADVAAAGYTDVIVVVGSDRTDAFTGFQKYIEPRTSPKYRKDTHIPLDSYRVVPVPVVRGGGSGVAGMSASKQRAFAVAGDYETFKQGVPGQNDRVARALYTAVRRHMQIKEFAHIRATIDTQTLRLPLTESQTVYEATDSKLRDQAKKVEKELHNKAYQEVSKRPYWRNRDFNQKFDNEVEDVYVTHLRAYLKQHPELKSIFKLHEATERDKAEKAGMVRRRIVNDVKALPYAEDRVYAAVELLLYLSKDSDQTPKIRRMIQDMAKNLDRILEENIQLPTDRTIAEAIAMPLKGHVYHKKTDAELWYVIKDASAAAHAMQSHNPRAEAKYLDQVNDAHTILHYRNNGGKRITEATTPHNRTGDTEVDRLKTRQKQDEIALKQRQANELMAAKLRDVQQKAREQQTKATAPKPASR